MQKWKKHETMLTKHLMKKVHKVMKLFSENKNCEKSNNNIGEKWNKKKNPVCSGSSCLP